MILKEIKLNVLRVLQSIMDHRHGATVPNRESARLLGCPAQGAYNACN